MFEFIIVIMIASVIMGTRTNSAGTFAAWVGLGVTLCCTILIVTGVDASTQGMATLGTALSMGVLAPSKGLFTHVVPGATVVQYTNTVLFMDGMQWAVDHHPLVHDNGNDVVVRTQWGTETYSRQSLTLTYRDER